MEQINVKNHDGNNKTDNKMVIFTCSYFQFKSDNLISRLHFIVLVEHMVLIK